MGGTARTLAYLYDAAGNRTRITHPDGGFITYDHDALGRITSVKGSGVTPSPTSPTTPPGSARR
jgi:YD repeat-containing protein